MRFDLVDITLVIDRSGSMEDIRKDAEGGVNRFVAEQVTHPGEARLTLVQFDTAYDVVHRGVPIQEVPRYRLVPRGATALLDAVGRAIGETGSRLAAMPEAQRPGLVVFVIVTDGLENSSRQFDLAQVRAMIEHQQSVYKWHFNYLAANQDAFAEAGQLGIGQDGAANWTTAKAHSPYVATSSKVRRMRTRAIEGESVSNDFTDEERSLMN